MNEIEARGKIKYRIANEMRKAGENKEEYEDLEIAIQALKEIREYRELGTIEELQELKEKNVIPIATIKFNKEDMQEIVDEKVAQIELDIQEIRNKAIDEFAERVKNLIREWYKACPFGYADIDEIAEKMKGGAE